MGRKRDSRSMWVTHPCRTVRFRWRGVGRIVLGALPQRGVPTGEWLRCGPSTWTGWLRGPGAGGHLGRQRDGRVADGPAAGSGNDRGPRHTNRQREHVHRGDPVVVPAVGSRPAPAAFPGGPVASRPGRGATERSPGALPDAELRGKRETGAARAAPVCHSTGSERYWVASSPNTAPIRPPASTAHVEVVSVRETSVASCGLSRTVMRPFVASVRPRSSSK